MSLNTPPMSEVNQCRQWWVYFLPYGKCGDSIPIIVTNIRPDDNKQRTVWFADGPGRTYSVALPNSGYTAGYAFEGESDGPYPHDLQAVAAARCLRLTRSEKVSGDSIQVVYSRGYGMGTRRGFAPLVLVQPLVHNWQKSRKWRDKPGNPAHFAAVRREHLLNPA